jgi:threonine aldolase
MKTVDLRSDTITQPTEAMRVAMMAAPLGDDVFGDDPTVNALQDRIAAITGKAAALFMPSGTQSNLCGILAHCGRGDEYIVGQLAHTYRYEGGGAAVFGSVQPQPRQDARAAGTRRHWCCHQTDDPISAPACGRRIPGMAMMPITA